jgi:hypothetical protein
VFADPLGLKVVAEVCLSRFSAGQASSKLTACPTSSLEPRVSRLRFPKQFRKVHRFVYYVTEHYSVVNDLHLQFTSTQSIFVLSAGPVDITVTFFSPVEVSCDGMLLFKWT